MLLLSGLLGAFLGAMMTFGFNMWKFHRDERNARCDELCKAIWDAGILASDYWSKKFDDSNTQAVQEARIVAAQTLMDGLYADFDEYLSSKTKDLDGHFSDLLDKLSGGQFTEEDRPIDLARAAMAPRVAGVTIVALRRLYRESIPFHGLGKAIRENRRRVLDMPIPRPR
ncbi:hypothetical protein [Rhizobium hidalgonense]|uniref:Uncharacterized protein n=1 Tax=Rhizobium hidalgonense TaxID=1538159 RepID=A0ABX4K129_9HYPH|nr:hypothetical protein [Rhizobium hidalgonense]PDT24797.1 hypothetical protein CO674_05525 [Rhizobium hidalgonense]PON05396.1 hypothetical protein ATY29_22835 [Rhizobium hidalgonense]